MRVEDKSMHKRVFSGEMPEIVVSNTLQVVFLFFWTLLGVDHAHTSELCTHTGELCSQHTKYNKECISVI